MHPAERYIKTIWSMVVTSIIHGGGRDWMWGEGVLWAARAFNCMQPPNPVPGHEGRSRLGIMDMSMTREKMLRFLAPFLCLAFKLVPPALQGANVDPKATPCVWLRYEPSKKAHVLLTIPNLYITYSVEVTLVRESFPLRVTNHLSSQIETFMRPTLEDLQFAAIRGPGGVMTQYRAVAEKAGTPDLVVPTPALGRRGTSVRQPTALRAGLESGAFVAPTCTSDMAQGNVVEQSFWAGGEEEDGAEVVVASEFVDELEDKRAELIAACEALEDNRPDFIAPCEMYGDLGDNQEGMRAPQPVVRFTPDQLAARTPRTTREALGGADSEYWRVAILADFAILRAQQCFINITDVKPAGRNPPPTEQRFVNKYKGELAVALADIPPKDFKARTVARGDYFKEGVHYDEKSAPVVHAATLKMVLAWAVQLGLVPYQADVSGAFYGNRMDREGVFVRLPMGFDPHSVVLRALGAPPLYGELAKALPGIPQGSLLQYGELQAPLANLGFVRAPADPCLFRHRSVTMAIILHVDDFVLVCGSAAEAAHVFGTDGLGVGRVIKWSPLTHVLGIDFKVVYTPERRSIFMSQRPYLVTILERADMADCTTVPTPAVAGRKYTKADCPVTKEDFAKLLKAGLHKTVFLAVAASIRFAIHTRADLLFILGKLAKFATNPGFEHWQALKRVLRFIKGTLDYGVQFLWRAEDAPMKDGPLHLVAYSDSSFADDVDTGRTTLGSVVLANTATIDGSSKVGQRVDACVNHSELDAFRGLILDEGAKQEGEVEDGACLALMVVGRKLAWHRGIKATLEQRDVLLMPPTTVYVDNAGVLSMVQGATLKQANKAIFKTMAEIRERVHVDKEALVTKIATEDNIANALTKQEPGLEQSAAQLRKLAGPEAVPKADG